MDKCEICKVDKGDHMTGCPNGETGELSCSAPATGSVSCRVDCARGDEGHCGRTEREFLPHCEKRFNEKRPQRGEGEQNDLNKLEQNKRETKA